MIRDQLFDYQVLYLVQLIFSVSAGLITNINPLELLMLIFYFHFSIKEFAI